MPNRTKIYLVLAVLGTVLPYASLGPWLLSNGLDVSLFIKEFFANRVSTALGFDVLISAVVLIVFALGERRRIGHVRSMVVVIGTILIGVSFGLPALLPFREQKVAT